MAVQATERNTRIVDKPALRDLVKAQNAEIGLEIDPSATPESVREIMRRLGIRAEDNIFSCGIIAAREEN